MVCKFDYYFKKHQLKYVILALFHHYGREGRESKKIDTKSLLLDFECFKNLVDKNFCTKFASNIAQFKEFLQNNNQGK